MLPHVVNEQRPVEGRLPRESRPASRSPAIPRPASRKPKSCRKAPTAFRSSRTAAWSRTDTVIQWQGDKVNYWPSTQAVSTVGGDLARALEVPAANVHVQMDYMGGGFGSKFPADRWHIESAHLSKASGGKPVKLFLDRATELTIAGVRPSHFAKIKIGAKKDGTIIAWQSESWSTGGFGGGGMAPLPYVFTKIPNYRLNHYGGFAEHRSDSRLARSEPSAGIVPHLLGAGRSRGQAEDGSARVLHQECRVHASSRSLSAAVGEGRGDDRVEEELASARSKAAAPFAAASASASIAGAARVTPAKPGRTIHPDGSVEIEIGTQDLGVGTRTILAMVAAETLGLPMSMVKVKLGDNRYPASGPSGGSTTVGGVSLVHPQSERQCAAQAVRNRRVRR